VIILFKKKGAEKLLFYALSLAGAFVGKEKAQPNGWAFFLRAVPLLILMLLLHFILR
jgi:hypothetical protein